MSTGVAARASSCRLSRVPVRLGVRRDAPKKSSTASEVVSSTDGFVRAAWVRAGDGGESWASMSTAGVVERSKRPKKVGRVVDGVEDEADIVSVRGLLGDARGLGRRSGG